MTLKVTDNQYSWASCNICYKCAHLFYIISIIFFGTLVLLGPIHAQTVNQTTFIIS